MVISERKLIIQVHNTWNAIDEQICTLRRSRSGDELEVSSIIKLENVLVNPYIAIVFIVEYQIRVKGNKSSSDSINVRFILSQLLVTYWIHYCDA